jgi:hypothetical protein
VKIAELHDEVCAALMDARGCTPESVLPAGYNGKKADAVFSDERIIVEVKSVCKDREQTEAATKRIDRVFDNWSRKGGPIVFGEVMVDVNTLPPPMASEVILCFGERIKTDLKDANRQIRETASALGWDQCYGITAFVVPATFHTHPGVIGHAAWDLLRRPDQAPWVNAIIIFSVPVRDHLPGGPAGELIISPHPRAGRTPEGFARKVSACFAKRFERSYGLPEMERVEETEAQFMSRFMGRKVGG